MVTPPRSPPPLPSQALQKKLAKRVLGDSWDKRLRASKEGLGGMECENGSPGAGGGDSSHMGGGCSSSIPRLPPLPEAETSTPTEPQQQHGGARGGGGGGAARITSKEEKDRRRQTLLQRASSATATPPHQPYQHASSPKQDRDRDKDGDGGGGSGSGGCEDSGYGSCPRKAKARAAGGPSPSSSSTSAAQTCAALYQQARQWQEQALALSKLYGMSSTQSGYMQWRQRHRLPEGTRVFCMAGGAAVAIRSQAWGLGFRA